MKIRLGALRYLIEAAIQPAEAAAEGLAVSVIDFSGTVSVIAYDPFALTNAVIAELQKNKRLSVLAALRMTGADCIVGTVDLRHSSSEDGPCYGAYIVQTTAARKGYGPLVYDLAISLGRPVIPDRRSVSTHAQKVWKTYLQSRGDVVKLPLDDKDNPKTKTVEDDCLVYPEEGKGSKLSAAKRVIMKMTGKEAEVNEPKDPRNYAYEAGSKAKYSEMLRINDKAFPYFNRKLAEIGRDPLSKQEWDHSLFISAAQYFNKRYGIDIYEL